MKLTRIASLTLLLILSQGILYAQDGIIQGRVYNANNNESIPFASIAVFEG